MVLAAAVLLQAVQQVQQYLARYKVVGRAIEQVSGFFGHMKEKKPIFYFYCTTIFAHICQQVTSQQLPAISFCPGYRPDKVKGKWWLRPNGGWKWERKGEEEVEEDMEAAWRELNFALEEVLVAVYYEKGEYDYKARDLLCQSKSFFLICKFCFVFSRDMSQETC